MREQKIKKYMPKKQKLPDNTHSVPQTHNLISVNHLSPIPSSPHLTIPWTSSWMENVQFRQSNKV